MNFIKKKSVSLGPFITYLISASYYTKRLILLIADTFFLSFSLWAAVSLRLEEIWPPVWEEFFWLFPAVPFITLPVFVNMGLYRAVIRYTGLDSIWTIFKASYAAFFLLLGLLLVHGFDGFPRSTPLIYFFFVFLLLGGSRLLFRTIYFRLNNPKDNAKRILIYGAGSSGRQMVTAFQNSTEFIVVGFIDDSPSLHKRKLNGISIFSAQDIPGLIEKLGPNEILLAMPSVTKKRKKEILHLLEPLPVEVKSLPSLEELVSNDINISDIQEIGIEDLLGRDSVPPRMELIHSPIAGKNVMVTGAGGSIGSELCRQ
ncbi:MAG: polysaccharide biosynthesis protein, partial [Desulfobulbaceae bacterium]|nr:polysaccharide biosynthesis protein [Desulfobulbaceae bacterium]